MKIIDTLINIDIPASSPAQIRIIAQFEDVIDNELMKFDFTDTILVDSSNDMDVVEELNWLIKNHPLCQLRNCESPIELKFYVFALNSIPGLKPQIRIGDYRVDFAIPNKRIVIEVDGHAFHSTRNQRTRDAKRERELVLKGWKVIRFTGSEIHKDVFGCINDAKLIVERSEYLNGEV